eukprot:2422269-Pleurochrysis_carterae.AAC.1
MLVAGKAEGALTGGWWADRSTQAAARCLAPKLHDDEDNYYINQNIRIYIQVSIIDMLLPGGDKGTVSLVPLRGAKNHPRERSSLSKSNRASLPHQHPRRACAPFSERIGQ